jgi:hypothetical protein
VLTTKGEQGKGLWKKTLKYLDIHKGK